MCRSPDLFLNGAGIGMSDHRLVFDRARLRSDMLRLFLEAWDRLRGERAAPARRDFGPEDFKFALPHMALVDVSRADADGRLTFRYRLVGSSLDMRLGSGLTGKVVAAATDGPIVSMYDAYAASAAWMTPTHAYLRVRHADGIRRSFERLVLPLSSDGASVDMLAVCIAYEGLGEPDVFRRSAI
jgi:hypothetical protein